MSTKTSKVCKIPVDNIDIKNKGDIHSHEGGCCSDSHEHSHDDGCGCGHDHGAKDKETVRFIIKRLALSAILLIGGFVVPQGTIVAPLLFLVSYFIAGYDIIWRAVKNITKGKVFDENFLMTIATVGAILIGEYPEGIAVMVLYQIGELFQGWAVSKSRKSIGDLMDITPQKANLVVNGDIITIDPKEVKIGDILIVRTGEKLPVDGIVIEGITSLNTSALTGESLPRDVKTDDEVLSGSINIGGLIKIKATKKYTDSTVAKILNLVENAASQKAESERFITKFSRYYTPAVVFSAMAIAFIPPIFLGDLSQWVYRALVFLVISCPCALVISVPLSFFAGIGGASTAGILIKGGGFLELLAKTDTVVFDKTGTLTKGEFSISEVKPVSVSKDELISLAAAPQQTSTHPIAGALIAAKTKDIVVENPQDIAGKGVKASYNGKVLAVGNKALMADEGINVDVSLDLTAVFISLDKKYLGYITLADTIKEDSKTIVKTLKGIGVKNTIMLTGDNETTAQSVNKQIGLDKVFAKLLPQDKTEKLSLILKDNKDKGTVVFVGDGINDAPVLTLADVGIAMGGVGSDAAIEAADIVIMTDEPSKIPQAIKISKKTMVIVKQNIVFAIGIKLVVMALGAIGIATMWSAVFADVGVSFLAILNATRALKVDKN